MAPPPARGGHDDHQGGHEDHGTQHQLGSDERAESHDDRSRHGTGPPRLHPDQQEERAPEPQEDHRHLEARRGELPHPGDHRDDQKTERQHGPLVVAPAQTGHGHPAGKEPAGRAHQAEDDRGPFERHRDHLVHQGQGEHPQGIGVDLDPFADVEDRAVAGQQIVDDPEVDEGVLVDPAVGPGADQDDDQRDQHRPPRTDSPAPAPPCGAAAGPAVGTSGSDPAVTTVFPRCSMAVMVVEQHLSPASRGTEADACPFVVPEALGYHPGDADTWSTSRGPTPRQDRVATGLR